MHINTFIGQQVLEITLSQILDALENGDAIATAKQCREQIVAAFNAALEQCGMPEDQMKSIKL